MSYCKNILLFCVIASLWIYIAADDSDFFFGPQTTTEAPQILVSSRIPLLVRNVSAVENGRSRSARLLSQTNHNGTMNEKSRALFETPVSDQGGSTSLETNFLSIQSGGSKFNHIGGPGRNLIGFNPQDFQPSGNFIPVGGPVPVDAALSPAISRSCRCEEFADCRDISAFARADRNRQDFCPPGQIRCCNVRKPIPANIIGLPQPQLVPQTPINSVGGLLPQGCGLKGGNPLARTFDSTNPRGDAEFGEYPWMTAILKNDLNYVCGGALIESRVVLTAAHCVAKVKGEDLLVRLGEFDVSETTEPPYQDVHVKKVIIHGDYHSGTLRNDMALLVLDQPVRMNSYIRPVCLPPMTDFTGLTCTVTGWGKNSPMGQYSNTLKEVDVPIIDNNQCQSMLRNAPELGPIFNLHDSFLCAGQAGKDACAGDGGSPLVCKMDGAWRLAGLVSWGIGCGQYPGAYVNVAKFLPWIQGVLRDNFQL